MELWRWFTIKYGINPVHTYASFGDYTVTLTVTGDGGSSTATPKVITIAATSIQDLLTGGQAANATGKTWVLDRAYTVGDGGGPVMNPPYILSQDSYENVLDLFGLGDEYDNEFTFFFDGKYTVAPKNGNVLAGAVYGAYTQTLTADPAWTVGLGSVAWSAPASSTWTLKTSDLVMEAVGDPNDPKNPPDHSTVTITGKNWISISSGAYFGILDFPSTTQFIIDEITPNKMRVTMFVCGYYPGEYVDGYSDMPSNMFHLSYIKK